MGGRIFMNYYKGHIDISEGEGVSKGERGVWLGRGGGNADSCN